MRSKIKKRQNYLRFLPKITALVAVLGAIYWLYQFIFIIRDINCVVLPDDSCDQAVTVELSRFKGLSLINVDTSDVASKITGADPGIVDINFTPKLPALLNVSITKTKPIARVAQSSSSAYLIIQDNGHTTNIYPENSNSLPIIYYNDLNYTHESVKIEDNNLDLLIKIVKLFNEYFIDVSSIMFETKNALHIKLSTGQTAIFDSQANIKRQIESLQLILSNTSSELPVKTIDVRLTKPIITTGESN